MAEDIDKVISWARSQGWTIVIDRNGYRRFYRPDGAYVVRYPAPPINASRRLADVVTALRGNGFPWPAPSKSEQRAQPRREGDT